MTETIEIRPFCANDSLAELTAVLHRAYAALGAMGLNHTSVDQSEEETRRRIAGGTCLVAVSRGVLVGTILYRPPDQTRGCSWYDRPEVASLHQFGVAPASQRAGVGSRLMQTVERLALESGAGQLALDTAEPAEHLRQFYIKRGYHFIEYAQWPGKVYRSVILSKILYERTQGGGRALG